MVDVAVATVGLSVNEETYSVEVLDLQLDPPFGCRELAAESGSGLILLLAHGCETGVHT